MKIKGIYAIEISGVCNLACSYCPYHLQQRPRGLMDERTFERVVDVIGAKRTKVGSPLHLHVFGEPLMHPKFERFARRFNRTFPAVQLSVSTNGVLLSEAKARALAEIRWRSITLSPHKPEAIPRAMMLLRRHGIPVEIHGGPDHSWAGQVEHPDTWKMLCEFSGFGKVVIRWNGDVALCCITDSGEGVIGNIHDEDIFDKEHRRFSLCDRCHLDYEEGRRVAERGPLVGDVARVHPVPVRQAGALAVR